MNDPTRIAMILGGLLALLGAGGWTRWRGTAALVLAVIALVGGVALKILTPLDAIYLPGWAGLSTECAMIALAAVYGVLLRQAGGLWLPGPPLLVAPLMGALMGDVAAAATLAGAAVDRRAAGRLALAAAGGAMIGRVGDPALLALGGRSPWLAVELAPVGLAMIALAWPRRELMAGLPEGRRELTALAAAVALLALVPGLALPALAVGCVVAGAMRIRGGAQAPGSWGPVAWALGSVALVLVATAGGVAEFAAYGVEQGEVYLGLPPLPFLAGVAGVLSLLLDGPATGLLAVAVQDRALDLLAPQGLILALAAGAGAGSIGPLVAAGAARSGLPRQIAAILFAVLWVVVVQHLR